MAVGQVWEIGPCNRSWSIDGIADRTLRWRDAPSDEFSGPSIAEAEVHRLAAATHAPPIKRGDLAAVDDYDVVVILDGEFGQNMSVSPKEILALLDRGKTVIWRLEHGSAARIRTGPLRNDRCRVGLRSLSTVRRSA
jgi:hypothetical protein